MKQRLFWLFAVVVLLAFGGFLYVAWPYRGLVPTLVPPSVDLGNAGPIGPLATNTQDGQPGKNETGLPLKIPQGFSMNVFAKELGSPRDLLSVTDGTLLVSIPAQGNVVLLEDIDRDGIAETTKIVLSGLNKPHGLAMTDIFPGESTATLYVAETDALVQYSYDISKQQATDRKVLAKLSTGGRHTSRSLLLVGNALYVANGSSCDVCHEEDAQRAAIWRYDLDTQTFELYARGLRNSVFLTKRDTTDEIWATEMGRDFLGDELPPDEINVIEKDKNYGWPVCYGKNIHDTVFDKNTYIRNPCMEPFETPSKIDLPAHSAPLGLYFLPLTSASGKWSSYSGDLLVAYHGSWNRTEPTGYKIRRFVLDDAGNVIKDEDFLSGWLDDSSVLGRPVDIEYSASTEDLYISDDRAGLVYRVTAPKQ